MKNYWSSSFWEKDFWKPVMALVSGTGLAQLLTLMAIPVLSRMYPPEEFGFLATYLAIVLSVAVIINAGYEWPIMLPEADTEAHQLLGISIKFAIGGSILALGFLGFFLHPIAEFAHWGPERGWYLLIPLSCLIEGFIQPLSMLINRNKAYRALSISKIARTSGRVGIALTLGWLGLGGEGLILAFVAGEVCCLIALLAFYLPWKRKKGFLLFSSISKDTLKAYRDFPKYAILGNWLNTSSKQLPYLLFPSLYPNANIGTQTNGLFHKADQLLSVPHGLIGTSVGNVYYEQGSKEKIKGALPLARYTLKTAQKLMILGLGVLILILLGGPFLFETVLGKEWRTAGVYAQYLSPYLYLLLIASPLSFIVDIERKLRPYLWFSLLMFALKLLTLLIGGAYLSPLDLVKAFALVSTILVGVQILLFLYWAGVFKLLREQDE